MLILRRLFLYNLLIINTSVENVDFKTKL